MLAAYRGQVSDTTPVAPEFWYYMAARVLGVSMIELQQDIPHWQALQATFKRYGCEGWGIVSPDAPKDWGGKQRTQTTRLNERQIQTINTVEAAGHRLQSRTVYDIYEPSWHVERYIKDFDADWPLYERMTLVPPETLDWQPVQAALDAVGEDYLLEVYVGTPFIDYAGGQREGGLEQVIFDLSEREDELRAVQERYIEHMAAKTSLALTQTTAKSIFVGSSWSSLSLLSPTLWRTWEKPVLEAIVQAAHAEGGLVHHHFHGRCMAVLPDLAALGLDCICPFERPGGGDVTDLALVRRMLGERVTFNGNVHTVETIIRGAVHDVQREVTEIMDAFAGSPRLIVGTGDQVGGETPDENIFAMIETVRKRSLNT
jgi:hypothetical protein